MEIYDRITRWKLMDALWDYNRGRFESARKHLYEVADRVEGKPSGKKKKRVHQKARSKASAGFHHPDEGY